MTRLYESLRCLLPLATCFLITISGTCAESPLPASPRVLEKLEAAKNGDAEAQYTLGLLFDLQKGFEEAFEWYRKAAEQGHAEGQSKVGHLYSRGEGVPQSYKEAANWYRKAAEQGDAFAQGQLGVLYYGGNGVLQDYKESAKWFQKAAEQGNAAAQTVLGIQYYFGHGVLKDMLKAYAWGNVASANGGEQASKLRDLVAKEMTPEQLAEAQKLSREWFEKYQPKNK